MNQDSPPIVIAMEATIASQRQAFHRWLVDKAAEYRNGDRERDAVTAAELAEKYLVEVGADWEAV